MSTTATDTPTAAAPAAQAAHASGKKLFNDENSVTLTGHLGKDPVLEYFAPNKAVVKFSLGSHQSWMKGDEEQKKTNWIDIVMRGDAAQKAATELRKGDRIRIQGALNYQAWETDGLKRSKHELAGFTYELLRRPAKNQQS